MYPETTRFHIKFFATNNNDNENPISDIIISEPSCIYNVELIEKFEQNLIEFSLTICYQKDIKWNHFWTISLLVMKNISFIIIEEKKY